MERYKIKFSKQAIKDKKLLFFANPEITTEKILNLMNTDPFIYPPSYEELKGNLTGYYSSRINRQHRIVYRVNESKKEIYIIRMWIHYDNIR